MRIGGRYGWGFEFRECCVWNSNSGKALSSKIPTHALSPSGWTMRACVACRKGGGIPSALHFEKNQVSAGRALVELRLSVERKFFAHHAVSPSPMFLFLFVLWKPVLGLKSCGEAQQ